MNGPQCWDTRTLRRFSVSILEEGDRLALKCLLLSYFRIGDYTTGTGEWLPNPNGEAPSLMRLVQQQECCRGTLCDELFPPALTAILDFYWTMRRSAPLCKYGNFWT